MKKLLMIRVIYYMLWFIAMVMAIWYVLMALKVVPNFSLGEKSWIYGTEFAPICFGLYVILWPSAPFHSIYSHWWIVHAHMCGSFIAVTLQNEQTWLKLRSWFVHNKYSVSSINLLLLSIIWLQRYVTKYKIHGICKFINFVSIWYSALYILHSQSTTLLPILFQVVCLTTLVFVASVFNLNWFLCWNVFLSW